MKTAKRDVFQALADPTRRAILIILATQAMTPNALAEQFDSSRQAVSKHIQILTECELLRQEKTGREIVYHLNPNRMAEIDKWIDEFKRLLNKRFNQLDIVLENLNKKK